MSDQQQDDNNNNQQNQEDDQNNQQDNQQDNQQNNDNDDQNQNQDNNDDQQQNDQNQDDNQQQNQNDQGGQDYNQQNDDQQNQQDQNQDQDYDQNNDQDDDQQQNDNDYDQNQQDDDQNQQQDQNQEQDNNNQNQYDDNNQANNNNNQYDQNDDNQNDYGQNQSYQNQQDKQYPPQDDQQDYNENESYLQTPNKETPNKSNMTNEELVQYYQAELENQWINKCGNIYNNKHQSQNIYFSILDDYQLTLQMDLQDCKGYIEGQVADQPLNYDQFSHHFLQYMKNIDEQNFIQKQQDQQVEQVNLAQFENINNPLPQHYQHNRQVIKDFLKGFNMEVYNYFKEFSKEAQYGDIMVYAKDVPLIIRVSFYYDNITFLKSDQDEEELFNDPYSYKIITQFLQRFFLEVKKEDPEKFDYDQAYVSFQDYQDFLDFWIRVDENLYVKTGEHFREIEKSTINDISQVQQQLEDKPAQTLVEGQIRQNIQNYENILRKQVSQQEQMVTKNILETLYKQLDQMIQAQQQSLSFQYTNNNTLNKSVTKKKPKKKQTKEQVRQQNLQEIFLFYAKQQYTQGPQYTFDRILHESRVLNLSKFMLFCKQFRIANFNAALSKINIPIIFKQKQVKGEINIEEFKMVLEEIAILMFEDRQEEFPTDIQKVEALYSYIGVDDPKIFKPKCQILNPAFNIQDKVGFRLLPKDVGRDIQLREIDPQTKASLKMRQQELNQMKEDLIKTQNEDQKKKRAIAKSGNQSIISQNVTTISKNQNQTYAQKYQEVNTHKLNLLQPTNKVSWDKLEKLQYSDITGNQQNNQLNDIKDSTFKPTDLFDDENDPEDTKYLAEYNLDKDQQQKKQVMAEHKKGQDSYGQIKKSQNRFDMVESRFMKPSPYQQKMNENRARGEEISNSYKQRANQIEKSEKQKSNMQLQNVQNKYRDYYE